MTPPTSKHSAVERFLADPRHYADGSERIDIIKTHGAIVFLGKKDVYKIKQPVSYSYMDFSTLEKRRLACERELALNRDTAPSIYIDLARITEGEEGRLELDGDGPVVEYAVHMHRFSENHVLKMIAQANKLTDGLAKKLGSQIAEYHQRLKPDFSVDQAIAVKTVTEQLSGNLRDVSCLSVLARQRFECLSIHQLQNLTPDLKNRSEAGFVRRCHGDLHLNNIVLLDDTPTPFDALEFDEAMATIDVLYDFAFLIMDMVHSGHVRPANVMFNQYVSDCWPLMRENGLRTLPLFLGLRAGVRALVACQTALQNPDEAAAYEFEGERYLLSANSFLQPESPKLLAVGGFSGTGKSTIARLLASDVPPAPGAVVLRSDVERKKLFRVEETDRLPVHAYDCATSERVYSVLASKAKSILGQGHSVIIDAVNARLEERQKLESLASESAVPFQGFWLNAPKEILIDRVRKRMNDASDADAKVVGLQHLRHKNVTLQLSQLWTKLNASKTLKDTLDSAAAKLKEK